MSGWSYGASPVGRRARRPDAIPRSFHPHDVQPGTAAAEKVLPWRRVATFGTAAVLLALGALLLTAPDAIPGLTIPAHGPTPGTDGMAP